MTVRLPMIYLSRPASGNQVQPSMLRVRTDKDGTKCTIDQFPAYSRRAVR